MISTVLLIYYCLKVKHGYKLEIQTPETMKLFGSTEMLMDKTKNGENAASLEIVK